MTETSVLSLFHINVEEQELPHQLYLVGNHSLQGQVVNIQGAGRGRNIKCTTTAFPTCPSKSAVG